MFICKYVYEKDYLSWMDTCLIQSVLLPTARLTNGDGPC